ncbi:MAG TPA: hypothetical protein VMH87_06840 [Pseudomonadales bacterium]|nr:hypothetical protein [Pseudomonadales bacterium]
MNQNQNTPDVNHASGAAVGFAIASVIFVVLVVIVKLAMTTPPIDAARAALISQALYQIRTNEVTQLNSPGWVDKPRGIVRLPIETAMQMAAQEWQNPAQARADLIARAKKSTAPAPKVANPYE